MSNGNDKLQDLNAECIQCTQKALKRNGFFDRSQCGTCPTGLQVHALDCDTVDISNSALYGQFFHPE